MSRVGKIPVKIPPSVSVSLEENSIAFNGPLGKVSLILSDLVRLQNLEGHIIVEPANHSSRSRALWGTTQRLVTKAVRGVSQGVTLSVDLVGVGYRASLRGEDLVLQLGFSHDVIYKIPEGISIKCEKPTSLSVSGVSAQLVGQVVAEIRKYRPPEPYKGKGVIRQGEFVVRKEGKKK